MGNWATSEHIVFMDYKTAADGLVSS